MDGFKDFKRFERIWNQSTQLKGKSTILTLIVLNIGIDYKEEDFPELEKCLNLIFKQKIDINTKSPGIAPTLLSFSVYLHSWNLFNYFLSKGAEIKYLFNYKEHKSINVIEYAGVLYQECKKYLEEANEELKNFDRLDNGFLNGLSESEITMQEYYALRLKSDILNQIIFIKELLEKYK